MCQCNSSQSRCRCSQSCNNNNNNSVRHLSIVTSTPCPNTNNGCGCGCGCGCNGSTQSTYSFCFLKSYLEDVLGWENVVEPCSNYGRRCHHNNGENSDLLTSLIGDESAQQLKSILKNPEQLTSILQNSGQLSSILQNTEQLRNFPPIAENFNIQELMAQALNCNFDGLEETVFE